MVIPISFNGRLLGTLEREDRRSTLQSRRSETQLKITPNEAVSQDARKRIRPLTGLSIRYSRRLGCIVLSKFARLLRRTFPKIQDQIQRNVQRNRWDFHFYGSNRSCKKPLQPLSSGTSMLVFASTGINHPESCDRHMASSTLSSLPFAKPRQGFTCDSSVRNLHPDRSQSDRRP